MTKSELLALLFNLGYLVYVGGITLFSVAWIIMLLVRRN